VTMGNAFRVGDNGGYVQASRLLVAG
jgi:hypothetical protein